MKSAVRLELARSERLLDRDRRSEHLGAEEAAARAIKAGVDVAIPMHHDMFAANPGDPTRFVAAVQRASGAASVLVPARSLPFTYSWP